MTKTVMEVHVKNNSDTWIGIVEEVHDGSSNFYDYSIMKKYTFWFCTSDTKNVKLFSGKP